MHPHNRFASLELSQPTPVATVARSAVRGVALCASSFLILWCAVVGLAMLAIAVCWLLDVSGNPKGIAVLVFATFGLWQGVCVVRAMWRH